MTTWLLIFLNVCNQSYLTVADTAYSEAKSAPSVMTIILIIIAAATLTKPLLCYCSKGLTPTNSITKTLNPQITYIYRFPIIHSTLIHLWRTAIEERVLAVELKKKKRNGFKFSLLHLLAGWPLESFSLSVLTLQGCCVEVCLVHWTEPGLWRSLQSIP